MSVINRMLRDLDARGALQGLAQAPTNSAVRAATAPRRRLGLLVLGGAAAVAVTGFSDWPGALTNPARLPMPVAMAQAMEVRPDAPNPQAVRTADEAASSPIGQAAASLKASLAERPAAATADVSAPQEPLPRADSSRSSRSSRPAASRAATPAVESAGVNPPSQAARVTAAGLPVESTHAVIAAPAAKATQSAQPADTLPTPPSTPPTTTPATRSGAEGIALGTGSVDKRMLSMPSAQRAQVLYRAALDMVATGHGRRALEKLHEALLVDPGLHAAHLLAVTLWLELGDPAQAEAQALQGLARVPGEPQLTYLLARVLVDRGDTAGAVARLNGGTRMNADAFGLRAALYSQQGDFARAMRDYEQAVRLHPGNSRWWLGLGVALESLGHLAQARQAYVQAQSVGIDRHDLNSYVDQKLVALDGAK